MIFQVVAAQFGFWGAQGISNILWIISWRPLLVSGCKFWIVLMRSWCNLNRRGFWHDEQGAHMKHDFASIYTLGFATHQSQKTTKSNLKVVNRFCKTSIVHDFLMMYFVILSNPAVSPVAHSTLRLLLWVVLQSHFSGPQHHRNPKFVLKDFFHSECLRQNYFEGGEPMKILSSQKLFGNG